MNIRLKPYVMPPERVAKRPTLWQKLIWRLELRMLNLKYERVLDAFKEETILRRRQNIVLVLVKLKRERIALKEKING